MAGKKKESAVEAYKRIRAENRASAKPASKPAKKPAPQDKSIRGSLARRKRELDKY